MEKMRKRTIAAVVCIAALFAFLCFSGGGTLRNAVAASAPALHAGSSHITATSDDFGKYRVSGQSFGTGDTYVYYDGIEIPQDGKIYISVDLQQIPYRDDADNWLTFMVGSPQSEGVYGPNTVLSGGKGPYYSQLMRVWRNGTVTGDYFTNGVVRGSIAVIPSYHFEICLQYNGSLVTVFINGQQEQTFTAADAATCHISFVQYSVISSDTYTYDVSVGNRAVCADTEYDLATGDAYADVPLHTMGNGTSGLSLYADSGEAIAADAYGLRTENGLSYLRLSSALLASEEGGTRSFTLQSGGGRSAFTVTTVDRTVAAVASVRYDKAIGGVLRLPIQTGTLTDVRLYDAQMTPCDGLSGQNEIVFGQEYFTEYGTYTFYTQGSKASGQLSALYPFTVTVYDSRNPAFADTVYRLDSATHDGMLPLAFYLYDGIIQSVRINGMVVPSDGYRVTADRLILLQSTAEQLAYGDNTLTVSTNKNEAQLVIEKTDSRTPTVATAVTVDKGNGAAYYVIAAQLYGSTLLEVRIGDTVLANREWKQVFGGVRIESTALPLAPDGISLRLMLNGGELQSTLTVIDSGSPSLSALHHYDDMYGADAVVVFDDGVCDYVKTCFGDADFPFAEYRGNVLYLSGGWFAAKIGEGSYRIGDTLVFSVVWRNRHTGRNVTSAVEISLYDSAQLYAAIPTFDKRNDTFVLPVFTNGYAVRYVKVNGAYTTAFEVTDGGIVFAADWVRAQDCGRMQYAVYTEAHVISLENTLEDSRSAHMTQSIVFRKGTAQGACLVPMEFYRNSVSYITDATGRNIAAYNYEVTEEGIVFDAAFLEEREEGWFYFFVGLRRQAAGLTIQEEQAFSLRILSDRNVTVRFADTYDLATADDIELSVDFGSAVFVGLRQGDEWLRDAAYLRVQRDLVLLRSAYVHTLQPGEHTFTLVTDGGETEFTVHLVDRRVNTFASDRLTVNKGTRTLTVYVQLQNTQYELYLDGKKLGKDDYAADGNYLTLQASFVKTLSAGDHTLSLRSGEGEDTLVLSVLDGSVRYAPWIALSVVLPILVISAVTLTVIFVLCKKKKDKKGQSQPTQQSHSEEKKDEK